MKATQRPFFAVAAALLSATSALAQTEGFSDVPDRFRIEAGGFAMSSDTELTFNTTGIFRPPINFESLDVPEGTTQFYLEGFWRPWRRHQFSLSWYRNGRDGDPRSATREFTWGDRTITAGTTVNARVNSSFLSGAYRFAAYKNDRFEIGPSIGIGRLGLTAGIEGEASLSSATGTTAGPFDIERSNGFLTGDVGGYFYWWPLRRLLVRGEMRYIYVSPGNAEASVTEGRGAVLYHPWRNFGMGLQYAYVKFRYDRDVLSTQLGGHLRDRGLQFVATAAF